MPANLRFNFEDEEKEVEDRRGERERRWMRIDN
jgi:hypothetical protein